jgi:predicted DNA-binding ribbon-helix-helix protein
MCKLFIGADARLWRTRLKSVRMRGYSEDIARRDGMNVPQLLAKLHEELIEAHGEIENFSSFLRVCCGRFLTLQLAGDVPRDPARPIRDLDAEGILRREAARMAAGERSPRHTPARPEPPRAAAP